MPAYPLDSNQPALMTVRLNVGRLGTCRLAAAIDIRNLTAAGVNAWTRTRAMNPDHNTVPQSSTWTIVKGT